MTIPGTKRPGEAGVIASLAALTCAWIALGGAGPAGGAQSISGCSSSQLSGRFSLIPGSPGAGHVGYALALRNRSARPCVLGRRPGLQLLGARGRTLPTHVGHLGAAGRLTIAPGASATARARFSPDVPGRGERQTGNCEPTAHALRVTLARPGHGRLSAPIDPPTAVCERGRMFVDVLR